MKRTNPNFLNGVPELVVLRLLSKQEMYGYEIVKAIQFQTKDSFSFGEGSGATVSDLSGHGNTGTIVNATWTTSGKYGKALLFNCHISGAKGESVLFADAEEGLPDQFAKLLFMRRRHSSRAAYPAELHLDCERATAVVTRLLGCLRLQD